MIKFFLGKMPRRYTRKREEMFSGENMKLAVRDVLERRLSLRQAAELHNVKKSSVANFVKKASIEGFENCDFGPQYTTRQVFSNDMEKTLEKYLVTCSNMYYGLTPKTTRQLAYQYAEKNNLPYPQTWKENKMAGRDWYAGFMERHSRLSLRTPEATSLARISSFNKTTVNDFQNKLESLLKKHQFAPEDIFNLDETGVTTVQKVQKVISSKGRHQVGQVTSRERGELITQVGIICASGRALPPVWIFPRKRFDEARMMLGVPAESGALGLVHSSGWMTSENFLKVLQHFTKHVRCSLEHKVLLIMDNHQSHLSVEGIDYAKENGIIILTLPPHTSNKMQPLDRTVFGPFKRFFNQGADKWMISHPGKTLTIYDLPAICVDAWDKAATPLNVKSGFRCTGICPFDRSVFSEEDFLSSFVTDRPLNATASNEEEIASTTVNAEPAEPVHEEECSPRALVSDKSLVTPSKIMPYPKAPPRKQSARGPIRKKSIIATDTPERDEIAAKKMKVIEKKMTNKRNQDAQRVKKKLLVEETSDEEEDSVPYDDASSGEEDEELSTEIRKDDYVICVVHGKTANSSRNFVARVTEEALQGYEVQFLRRHVTSNRFTVSDEKPAFIMKNEVVIKLPNPIIDKRPRYLNMLYFNTDFREFGII